MTPEELAADQAVIEAATEGPWFTEAKATGGGVYSSKVTHCGCSLNIVAKEINADAAQSTRNRIWNNLEFIREARTRWPVALMEIERLRAIVEAATDMDRLESDVDASELARLREEVTRLNLQPFQQTRLHSGTQNGNCFATCLSVLLGYDDYRDVPQWESEESWQDYFERYTTYLAERDLFALRLEGHPKLNHYYIASGNSSRGLRHACIYKEGELFHDPHPDGTGLLAVDFVEVIADIGLAIEWGRKQLRVEVGRLTGIQKHWEDLACQYIDERDQARAALRQVEWIWSSAGLYDFCPWCLRDKDEAHAPDCPRQAALGLNEEEGAT